MKQVVVVGAGITGCATAYLLAKQGVSVTLVDADGVGRHASGNNPGGLNPHHGPEIPGRMSGLALRSFELHQQLQPEIAKLSGIDFQGHLVSRLELAYDEEELRALETAESLYNSAAGFSAEWITPDDLHRREPRIGNGVLAALWTEGNGMVEGALYTQAMAQAGQQLGVRLVQEAVVGMELTQDRVTQVVTDSQRLSCDAVVVATGSWFEGPSRWLGQSIPVTPLKGQLLLADMPGEPWSCHVLKGAVGLYAMPSGRVWLGGTQEDVGHDATPTPAGRATILEAIAGFIPGVAEADIVGHVAALRPVTPDRLPVLGRVGAIENAFVASGAGVKGMLLSMGMAEAVSESVLGRELPASYQCFAPGRFAANL